MKNCFLQGKYHRNPVRIKGNGCDSPWRGMEITKSPPAVGLPERRLRRTLRPGTRSPRAGKPLGRTCRHQRPARDDPRAGPRADARRRQQPCQRPEKIEARARFGVRRRREWRQGFLPPQNFPVSEFHNPAKIFPWRAAGRFPAPMRFYAVREGASRCRPWPRCRGRCPRAGRWFRSAPGCGDC